MKAVLPFLAIGLSAASLWYSIQLWGRQAPLLERCYIWEYVRLQAPEIPTKIWKHTVVLVDKRPADLSSRKADHEGHRSVKRAIPAPFYQLATPTDSGEFRLVKGDKPAPAWFLHDVIYQGRSLQQVLQWPLIASGAVLALLLIPAMLWQASMNKTSADGRILRGPRVISNLHWKLRMLFKKKGFYLETR